MEIKITGGQLVNWFYSLDKYWISDLEKTESIVTIYDVKRLIELSQSNPIPDGETPTKLGSDELSNPDEFNTATSVKTSKSGRDTFDKDLEDFKL